MRSLLVLSLVLLAAPDLRAAVEIRVSGEHVDIQATNAPLADILEGLSRQAPPMKIVYEGPPPRQLLSVDLKGRTPAEAVMAILEGQGLSYTVALDPSGTRVQTLLMAGGNNAPSAARLPASRPERPARAPIRESVEEVVDEGMEEGEEQEPQPPPDTGRPTPPRGRAAEQPPPTQGVFLPAPGAADYPTSVFAPKPPPAPEETQAPKAEATPPPFNP